MNETTTLTKTLDKIVEVIYSNVVPIHSISTLLFKLVKIVENEVGLLEAFNAADNSNITTIESASNSNVNSNIMNITVTESLSQAVSCYVRVRGMVNQTLLDRQRRVLSNIKSFISTSGPLGLPLGLPLGSISTLPSTTGGTTSGITSGTATSGTTASNALALISLICKLDFGKWHSLFFKILKKMHDSIAKIVKYQVSNQVKKMDKEIVLLDDLFKKWEPLALDFCKDSQILIQAFEAWWRTGLGEELLALFIGAHDFLNDGIESLSRIMAIPPNTTTTTATVATAATAAADNNTTAADNNTTAADNNTTAADNNTTAADNNTTAAYKNDADTPNAREKTKEDSPNGAPSMPSSGLVDKDGFTIPPHHHLGSENDPFKMKMDESDDEEQVDDDKLKGLIQISIKDDVIKDSEADTVGALKSVQQHLAMGMGMGPSAGQSKSRGRTATGPVINTSHGQDDPVKKKKVWIKTVETWNCIIDSAGSVDKVLLTGQVIVRDPAHCLVPGTRITLDYNDKVIEKMVENGEIVTGYSKEDGEGGGESLVGPGAKQFIVNDGWRDTKVHDPTSFASASDGMPFFKYMVNEAVAADKVPFSGTVFWRSKGKSDGEDGVGDEKEDDCVVDLLVLYRHSPALLLNKHKLNDDGVRICARLGGRGDVGGVEAEPVVEWDLDSRLLVWTLRQHEQDGSGELSPESGSPDQLDKLDQQGRIVCRVEAFIPALETVKDVDVVFTGKGWSVGCPRMQIDFVGNGGEEVNVEFQVEYQTGVYQLVGSLID